MSGGGAAGPRGNANCNGCNASEFCANRGVANANKKQATKTTSFGLCFDTTDSSLSYDKNLERIRRESTTALSRLSRQRISDRQIDIMRLLIQRDRPGAARSRYVFDDIVFAAHLLNVGGRPIAIRADRITSARVKSNAVGPLTYCGSGQDLSCIRIRNSHQSVAAYREKATLLQINSKTGRRVARGQGISFRG